MWLSPSCITDFQSWEVASRLFWQSQSKTGASGDAGEAWIYVDLMHDSSDYLLRALTTARYLAGIVGGRLVGVLGTPGVVRRSCSSMDPALVRRVAAAFDIDEIVTVPEPFEGMGDFLQDLGEAAAEVGGAEGLRGLHGERLRALLLRVQHDGLPIGHYAYETLLRGDLVPSVDALSTGLLEAGAGCVSVDRWIRGLFAERPPTWFVTGHIDYNPWGVVGWRTLETGGRVCWFSVHGQMGARILSGPPPADGRLTQRAREGSAALFESAIWPHNPRIRDAVVAFHRRRRTGTFHKTWNTLRVAEYVPPPATRTRIAAALRVRLGLPPDRPTVGILCHALTDTPQADHQIYADYGLWLSATLAFAAERPDRSWLVKPHPVDAAYDTTKLYRRLSETYAGLPHIRFGGLPDDAWPLACDVATTVRGSPGFELTCRGIPVVLAGRSLYSDHGFCRIAESEEEYRALLTAPPTELALTAEAIERAQLHAYAEAFALAVPSLVLPPFAETFAAAEYWRDRRAALNWLEVAADPWYQALEDAVQRLRPRTLAPAFRSAPPDPASPNGASVPPIAAGRNGGTVAETAVEAALAPGQRPAAIPFGECLAMSIGGKGLEYVVSGPLYSDGWMTGEPVLMVLPLLTPTEAAGIELEIEATAFVPPDVACVNLDIRIDGVVVGRMAFGAPDSHAHRLPLPECRGTDGTIVLELCASPANVPAMFSPESTEDRALSVRLRALTVHAGQTVAESGPNVPIHPPGREPQ